MKAQDLIERLDTKYPFDKGWLSFQEMTARLNGMDRRIDWLGLHTWASGGYRTMAVEVKVSRSDWLRELGDPTKREPWERAASEFWFCCAKGVVEDKSEIPEGCGLLEPYGSGLRVKRRAHYTKGRTPSDATWLRMLTRFKVAADQREHEFREFVQWQGRTLSISDLRRIASKYQSRWTIDQEIREALEERRKKSKCTAIDWMGKWDNVFNALHRAMRESGEDVCWKPDPGLIAPWVTRRLTMLGAEAEMKDLATRLRALADELEPKGDEQ